jgi:hypothetical protein
MYWFKSKARLLINILIITLLTACKPDVKETGAALKYFDLKGYFIREAIRLNKMNKVVVKTVSNNGVTESKKVHIGNWSRELDLFIGSDINRPAWKNSYDVSNSDNILLYRAKFPELTTHEIIIKRENQQIKWILIFNGTKNKLYETIEKLTYYPDSLYAISKFQRVRFMGNNNYKVQGIINR